MPFFENRSGEKLWYEDTGEGTALVFIHGWCMSSAVWHYQFTSLSSTFRLVAPDLRGHGSSRFAAERLDFATFAADLADLLNALDLSGVILIGWSMGGQIALEAYREISERIAGLVLVSATPCFTAKTDFPHGLAWKEADGMRVKVGRNAYRALEGFHGRMFTEGELENHPSADNIRALLAEIMLPDTGATLAALASLACADMRHLLPAINSPALVMNGDHDRICLPQASQYLVQHIPAARQKVFVHSGHAPFLTRSEEFNTALITFAESLGSRK